MAAARSVPTSEPLALRLPAAASCRCSNNSIGVAITQLTRGFQDGREKKIGLVRSIAGGDVGKKQRLAATTSEEVVTSERQTNINGGVVALDDHLASLLAKVADPALVILKLAIKRQPWNKLYAQMFIERGCFIVAESYFQYFLVLSQRSDPGSVVHQLIGAIDMFLVAAAMLTFGMGVHVMFVGSKNLHGTRSKLPASNLFGLFPLKALPRWVCMQSVKEAKSRMGHAVIMILQVGVLEKFTTIPLVTGFDLACFAAALLVSSACIFLLSRLSFGGTASHM
ncbi:uncharacterized protein LOC127807304 isoform X2 [Diospyros lotus]|uniref:uncharacterized protein LOC127807304 isoform X2 n=1 Tax=Diospyros lotus TaxID=55363 RepID=UPI0022525818|nr:uncharacterized protein LOC127807304 isoform X2 [Diospyros lotus]